MQGVLSSITKTYYCYLKIDEMVCLCLKKKTARKLSPSTYKNQSIFLFSCPEFISEEGYKKKKPDTSIPTMYMYIYTHPAVRAEAKRSLIT